MIYREPHRLSLTHDFHSYAKSSKGCFPWGILKHIPYKEDTIGLIRGISATSEFNTTPGIYAGDAIIPTILNWVLEVKSELVLGTGGGSWPSTCGCVWGCPTWADTWALMCLLRVCGKTPLKCTAVDWEGGILTLQGFKKAIYFKRQASQPHQTMSLRPSPRASETPNLTKAKQTHQRDQTRNLFLNCYN